MEETADREGFHSLNTGFGEKFKYKEKLKADRDDFFQSAFLI